LILLFTDFKHIGWTRCPHEIGTNAREAFRAFPVSSEADPIVITSDDPDQLIELELSNVDLF